MLYKPGQWKWIKYLNIIAAGLASVISGAAAFGKTEAVDVALLHQRQTVCLNGVWSFQTGSPTSDAIPTEGWRPLRVPSTLRDGAPENFAVTVEDTRAGGIWYQHEFNVPQVWNDGRRIQLQFMAIEDAHRIFVNGIEVAASPHYRLCATIDVTDVIQFGQSNSLNVRVEPSPDWSEHFRAGQGDFGIFRDVYLKTTPPVHAVHSLALPSVRHQTLGSRVLVRNASAEHQRVRIAVSVMDQAQEVLSFQEETLDLAPGEEKWVENRATWKDPVLWGYGEYGTSYLYHLRTRVVSDDNAVDERWDRFGFREFRTQGSRFLLNEKSIRLTGDLISRAWLFIEHPAAITAYYQGMRSININFQRMHSSRCNFDSKAWYTVGDELGHLVQAQNLARDRHDPANLDLLENWQAYVLHHFNHPSIVMWSLDNEAFSAPYPLSNAVSQVVQRDLTQWSRLASFVRELDPTRVIQFEHGWSLWAAVQAGSFDRENYQTFNMHPYNRVRDDVARAKNLVGFKGEVPVMVGEVFDFPASIEVLTNPAAAFVEQRRRGLEFREAAESLLEYGVAGVVLCAIQRAGFIGYTTDRSLHLGPWSDRLLITENDEVAGEHEVMVQVRWPSLSGEGVKTRTIRPHYGAHGRDGGYGHNFNWFDPNVPMFRGNVAGDQVRIAFRAAHKGKDLPPLAGQRAADVVIVAGSEGQEKTFKGAYAWLEPTDGQARPIAVSMDSSGMAWFRVWDEGKYRAVVSQGEQQWQEQIEVSRPAFTDSAGYAHVQWVSLAGADVTTRQAVLAQPATFNHKGRRIINEVLSNGDFAAWSNGHPINWNGEAEPVEIDQPTQQIAAKVAGNTGQLATNIRLEPGARYRLSGHIRKLAGASHGQIGVRGADWTWLVTLRGTEQSEIWEHVTAEFEASGDEAYLYCFNRYMGDEGACLYANLSLRKIADPDENSDSEVNIGPFKPDGEGFLTHWLALGPFPNQPLSGNKHAGHENDLLAEHGGETRIRPKPGEQVVAQFVDGDFWIEGDVLLKWRLLHASNHRIPLEKLTAPSVGAAASPPAYVANYLACYVESEVARNLTLALGTDDGHKVWLNGRLVGASANLQAAKVDEHAYPVRVRAGKNILLIKVFQASGNHAAYVRFIDGDKPVRNLTIALTPDEADDRGR